MNPFVSCSQRGESLATLLVAATAVLLFAKVSLSPARIPEVSSAVHRAQRSVPPFVPIQGKGYHRFSLRHWRQFQQDSREFVQILAHQKQAKESLTLCCWWYTAWVVVPVISVEPKRALNSSKRLPSVTRAIILRMSMGALGSAGMMPPSSSAE